MTSAPRRASTRPPTRFAIGQLVRILASGQRGVVVDIDFGYEPDDAWHDDLACEIESPSAERPWIRLLLDGGGEAYVSDDRLAPDTEPHPIRHPHLEHTFDFFVDGHYARTRGLS